MTRLFLAAGVAAIAITAPAASAPGGKHGAADKVERTQTAKAQKARGGEARSARVERRSTARAERTQVRERPARVQRAERTQVRERPARVQRQERQAQRIQSRPERATVRAERQAARTDRSALRAERQANRAERIAVARDRNVVRVRDVNGVVRARAIDTARGYGVGGCPPGLAKKAIACMPPGQAQKLAPLGVASRNLAAAAVLDPISARRFVGQPLSVLDNTIALSPMPLRLQSIYPSTPQYYYQYGNGYAYQINRESQLISALLPLFGLGYSVGQPFPATYSNYYLPSAYQPFYANSSCGYSPFGDNDYERYVNGYVYEIDCRTGLVEDIDPMLGYGYGYGQMMPMTYSAYNVPYQYRSMYYDTSNAYYRYAPGAIYQVDPTTSLITAVAALLTGGLNVGQPLPVGYSAYNVPLSYRTTYYDTPDNWYRYADGYIYRVNPVNGLVTERVVVVV